MERNYKSEMVIAIRKLDPESEIVQVDTKDDSVLYSNSIIQHRLITHLSDEELVRAYLVTALVKIYGYETSRIELERPVTIGRTEVRIDITITHQKESNKPFMIFEVKAPGSFDEEMETAIENQLFAPASIIDRDAEFLSYLCNYTSYYAQRRVTERMVVIDYKRSLSYESWVDSGEPNLLNIPKDYSMIERFLYVKGSDKDLRTDISINELDRLAVRIHNVLWGGGKYAGNIVFNNLLKLFLTKIYDEKETEKGKPYTFQILYEHGEPESAERLKERIEPLYRKVLKEYLKFDKKELEKAFVEIDDYRVRYIVQTFQGISFVENEFGLLGDFFERIIRNEFKQSKGQFFTHNNIVKFINRALCIDELALEYVNKEKRLPFIIDPACGSGKFLTDAMQLVSSTILEDSGRLKKSLSIREFTNTWFPESRTNFWATRYIYGIENNIDLATATKVNMIGHHDGSGNIEANDALADSEKFRTPLLQISKRSDVYPKPVNEQFDVVVSNPPFRITIDEYTARNLPNNFVWGEKIKKSLGKSEEKKKEVDIETLFIECWYKLLRPGGRLGVVLPDSIFNSILKMDVRVFMLKYFVVKGIVSLPYLAFQPYTATKTSLLFAQKKTTEEVKEFDRLWNKAQLRYDKALRSFRRLKLKMKSTAVIEDKDKQKLLAIVKSLFDNEILPETIAIRDFQQCFDVYSQRIQNLQKDQWIMKKVTKEIDYPIFMAHAEEIGYKRSKYRGELERPNHLFTIKDSDIVMDPQNPNTILDFFRKDVLWD